LVFSFDITIWFENKFKIIAIQLSPLAFRPHQQLKQCLPTLGYSNGYDSFMHFCDLNYEVTVMQQAEEE